MALRLNRRHKAILFLTVLVAGVGLLIGASAEQAAGVALVGLALAWLCGGLRERVLWVSASLLALLAGLYVAASPVRGDWEAYRVAARSYDRAISGLTLALQPGDWFAQNAPKGSEPWPDEGGVLKAEGPPWKLAQVGPWEDMSPPHARSYDASGERQVTLPESVQSWERPLGAPDFVASPRQTPANTEFPKVLPGDFFSKPASVVLFPSKTDDREVLSVLERQLLLPRPTFSLWASLARHWQYSLGGLVLALSGFSGLALCIKATIERR